MAINMFVTNIPNGTSIQIMRGTAIHLAKKALYSKKVEEDGTVKFDALRISQLAGSLGVSEEEARDICLEMLESELSVEEVIDRHDVDATKRKNATFEYMRESLRKIDRLK